MRNGTLACEPGLVATIIAAFDMLSQASQRSNRKLAVLAEEVASTGILETP